MWNSLYVNHRYPPYDHSGDLNSHFIALWYERGEFTFPLFSFDFIFFRRSFVDLDERKQSDVYIKPLWLLLYLLSARRSWIPSKSILHEFLCLIVTRQYWCISLCTDIFNSPTYAIYRYGQRERNKRDGIRRALVIRPREFFPVFRA